MSQAGGGSQAPLVHVCDKAPACEHQDSSEWHVQIMVASQLSLTTR